MGRKEEDQRLDDYAKSLDWSDGQTEYGSTSRMAVAYHPRVAQIVNDEAGILLSNNQEFIGEHVLMVVIEHLTGVPIRRAESRSDDEDEDDYHARLEDARKQWNLGNIWDPTAGTKLHAYVRGLAKNSIHYTAQRHKHTASKTEEANDLTIGTTVDFDEPFTIIRPMGRITNQLRELTPSQAVDKLDQLGLTTPDLDELEPRIRLAHQLARATNTPENKSIFTRNLPPTLRPLADLYWKSQYGSYDEHEFGRRLTLITRTKGSPTMWETLTTLAREYTHLI